DRCAADRTRRRRALLPLEHLVADLDLLPLACAGGLEDGLELGARRRAAGDTEPALGPEDAIGASRRLRAIDEIVDELLLVAMHDLLGGNELEEGALELVDAGAGRGRDLEHAQDALVVDAERRRLW